MTYKGGEYSFNELLKELKQRAKKELIQSDYEYLELIDGLIEEKKSQGYFSEDEDMEQLKSDLEIMWPEVEKYLQDEK
ncbi:MAG: hypothetical protein NT136_04015 [Candidatus Moranbacteria bacterium]|nr:hypothetical protein [Candidatus Moranbacteria bacterium]